MKTYLTLGLIVALVFSMGVVLAAKPDFAAEKVEIPSKATKVGPNIFYLETAVHEGKTVEREKRKGAKYFSFLETLREDLMEVTSLHNAQEALRMMTEKIEAMRRYL